MSWKSVVVGIGVVAFGIVLLVSTGAGQRLVLGLLWRKAGMTSTVERIPNAKTPGSYYRYRTVFKVDGSEELVFDNVVACNTRITRSKAHGESVLNGITPNLFVRRTKDNHALLVVTPELCSWARTNSHEKNYTREGFMPPAVVWFDDADDLTFGIAYVTRTAYASKKSRLELVSTYVGPATRDEFEVWYDGPRKENLAKQEWINPPPGTTRERWEAHNAYINTADSWSGRKLFPMNCRSVHRLRLTEEARALVRPFWPANYPKYWIPSKKFWDDNFGTKFIGSKNFLGNKGRNGKAYDFWSRFGGISTFGPDSEGRRGQWPAETYPRLDNDVTPFLTEEIANGDHLTQNILFESGANDGFAACYSGASSMKLFDRDNLKYWHVEIDESRAYSESKIYSKPVYIFERDKLMFRAVEFSLHPNGGIE